MKICKLSILALALPFMLASSLAAQSPAPASFSKDVLPIFTASCIGCHSPEKKKGGLDMTTVRAVLAGGKEHGPGVVVGDPEKSPIILMTRGNEPEMPAKGDPLKLEQIELLARWIKEGAKDDSPTVAGPTTPGGAIPGPAPIEKAPTYAAPPIITALAYSPDGSTLAVSGYHEILLHKSDGTGLTDRLLSGTPRIDSIVYSGDGKMLASSGGAPAVLGHIQIWDTQTKKQTKNWQVSKDTVFGLSFSPDAQKIAVGCADRSSRVLQVADGKEVLRMDQHADWCLTTLFTVDGKKLVTGGRDKALKFIDGSNGQLIDDVSNPLEMIYCMARHPKEDKLAYGGDQGVPRFYRISDNQGRTAARNDTNLIRAYERQPGPVRGIAFSPDGELLAVGSTEVRIYKTKEGAKVASCTGHDGAIYAVAFHPNGKQIATGGYDGMLRIFDATNGSLVKAFSPISQ